jgi:hypothetical protein
MSFQDWRIATMSNNQRAWESPSCGEKLHISFDQQMCFVSCLSSACQLHFQCQTHPSDTVNTLTVFLNSTLASQQMSCFVAKSSWVPRMSDVRTSLDDCCVMLSPTFASHLLTMATTPSQQVRGDINHKFAKFVTTEEPR